MLKWVLIAHTIKVEKRLEGWNDFWIEYSEPYKMLDLAGFIAYCEVIVFVK